MLTLLHNHPHDKHIMFEERAHKYTIKGDSSYTSVTTFIKKFFNEFDADKVIGKMIRFGVFEKKYGGQTPQEVKDGWKSLGKEASERGTKLHKFIEDFYNGVEGDMDQLDKEVGMFYEFVKTTRTLKPFRTEWCIWDEQYKIAGSIDMLFQIQPAKYPEKVAIYDWKCSKEIKVQNKYDKARAPIAHLDDCNKNHYSLQLNLYKFILEKNYGLKVVEMYLVVIHRNFENFTLVPISNMQTEIRNMLATVV